MECEGLDLFRHRLHRHRLSACRRAVSPACPGDVKPTQEIRDALVRASLRRSDVLRDNRVRRPPQQGGDEGVTMPAQIGRQPNCRPRAAAHRHGKRRAPPAAPTNSSRVSATDNRADRNLRACFPSMMSVSVRSKRRLASKRCDRSYRGRLARLPHNISQKLRKGRGYPLDVELASDFAVGPGRAYTRTAPFSYQL